MAENKQHIHKTRPQDVPLFAGPWPPAKQARLKVIGDGQESKCGWPDEVRRPSGRNLVESLYATKRHRGSATTTFDKRPHRDTTTYIMRMVWLPSPSLRRFVAASFVRSFVRSFGFKRTSNFHFLRTVGAARLLRRCCLLRSFVGCCVRPVCVAIPPSFVSEYGTPYAHSCSFGSRC